MGLRIGIGQGIRAIHTVRDSYRVRVRGRVRAIGYGCGFRGYKVRVRGRVRAICCCVRVRAIK